MATLNVTLPADLIDFVQSEIANGSYASADEMVSEALLMLQRETELEEEKLAILRREIAEGLADAAAGRLSQLTIGEIADEVLREEFSKGDNSNN